MKKLVHVEVPIDFKLKRKAENILRKCGITPDEAITALYKFILNENALPESLKILNIKR